MQERPQLRDDAVDGTREDADDGVDHATNEGQPHKNTSLSEEPSCEGAYRSSQRSYSSNTKQATKFLNPIQRPKQLEKACD